MSGHGEPSWLARFRAPRHALSECAIIQWHRQGESDTPAADARCRICLAIEGEAGRRRIAQAAFAVYGPPAAIASADWLCERLAGRSFAQAAALGVPEIETALGLRPAERYVALLVLDALAAALDIRSG